MKEIKIFPLTQEFESSYGDFLMRHPGALFYHSLTYRDFLKKILQDTEDIYLLALQDTKIVGVFPVFLKRLSHMKTIINSLPFFGSHGGVLIDPKQENAKQIKKFFLEEILKISKERNAVSLTIIDNPLDSSETDYEDFFGYESKEMRISQITNISIENKAQQEAELMAIFHSKTRNMVRKSKKGNFKIRIDNSLEGFRTIYKIHSENMSIIGGKEKPQYFFEEMYKSFKKNEDYNIYFSYKDNDVAAGLLVFYYKDFCEYFTPVVEQKFRSDQPLSGLIFQAMQDACDRGIRFWNWGGSWLSQDGVYLFKKRWGAKDTVYKYFNLVFDQKFLNQNLQELLSSSYFYIQPIKIGNNSNE